jgi:effector-binding domain-containing protein
MHHKYAALALALAAFACAAEDAKLDIQLKDVKKQTTLVVKTKAKKADIGAELKKVYPKIYDYLKAQNLPPSAPIALYHTADGENFEIEAGVIVPEGTKGEGDIVVGELPAGKAAVAVHVGAYDTLGKTYGAIMHYLEGKKLTAAGPAWEVYTDPGKTGPADAKTEVYVLTDKK